MFEEPSNKLFLATDAGRSKRAVVRVTCEDCGAVFAVHDRQEHKPSRCAVCGNARLSYTVHGGTFSVKMCVACERCEGVTYWTEKLVAPAVCVYCGMQFAGFEEREKEL